MGVCRAWRISLTEFFTLRVLTLRSVIFVIILHEAIALSTPILIVVIPSTAISLAVLILFVIIIVSLIFLSSRSRLPLFFAEIA